MKRRGAHVGRAHALPPGCAGTPRPGPRTTQRGFTLVELLMATTAGLLVSAAAFLLARSATTVFQEETRVTAAQLSASLGLRRIAADLGRAGFLGTPNIATDPFVANESATWPLAISKLQAFTIEENGSAGAQNADNQLFPDRITITGSFDTAEIFPVRTIQPGGTGKVVYLETSTLPMARTCRACGIAACLPALERIFQANRIVRILTPSGSEIFGIVESVQLGANEVAVKLQGTPNIPQASSNPRGYEGDCNYCQMSVLSTVRYEIQSLAGHPQYGALVAPLASSATGDAGRTELTRVELDKDLLPIPDTLELVAEFAVDLKLGISFIDANSTTVTHLPPPQPPSPLIDTTKPERVRSIHVRFATRARAPDREVDLPAGPDGRRYRFKLPITGKTVYARMRTLYTEVALQNLVRATW
jgi:prepilin-type N-terminal cleavage/methylation domain-containing protein